MFYRTPGVYANRCITEEASQDNMVFVRETIYFAAAEDKTPGVNVFCRKGLNTYLTIAKLVPSYQLRLVLWLASKIYCLL
jgi:hypothetical protein